MAPAAGARVVPAVIALLWVVLSRAADLGPPATTYGARDPVAPTALEATVEALALGTHAARLAPSGPLRTYARGLLSVPPEQAPDVQTRWFLAEHAGLHALPSATRTFTFHGQDAAEMAAFVRTATAEWLEDPRVREVAIAVGDLVGGDRRVTVAFDDRSVRLAPFPRRYEPGAVAQIRGENQAEGELDALYMNWVGAEVKVIPLGATGRFDLDVPLPDVPGAYRVVIGRYEERAFPEDAFFFTFYVGIDPPRSVEEAVAMGPPVAGDLLTATNAERARYGLARLEGVPNARTIDRVIEKIPDGEAAAWRYLRRKLSLQDPVPELPHGWWSSGLAAAGTREAVAWSALQNPMSRLGLLRPTARHLAIGESDSLTLFSVLDPVLDSVPVRDAARRTLAARFAEPPRILGAMEAELDAIAQGLADDKLSEEAVHAKLKGICAERRLVGPGHSWVVFGTSTHPPDLTHVTISPDARVLAIGQGTGLVHKKALTPQTVLLIVVAKDAP
jgi:hypothetical protein